MPNYDVKDGVILDPLRPEMVRARDVAAALWAEHGQTLTITSGRDGAHTVDSLHFLGLALDFRTRDLAAADVTARADALLERLGAGYDVRIERTHLHVEYDGQTHARVADKRGVA